MITINAFWGQLQVMPISLAFVLQQPASLWVVLLLTLFYAMEKSRVMTSHFLTAPQLAGILTMQVVFA